MANKKRGKTQALIELAVLGTILITAFAWVLFVIQQMNDELYVIHKAFREALKEGYKANSNNGGEVKVLVVENRKFVTPFFNLGGKNTILTAAASVDLAAKPVYQTPYDDLTISLYVNEDKQPKIDQTKINYFKFVELDKDVIFEIRDDALLYKKVEYKASSQTSSRQRYGIQYLYWTIKNKKGGDLAFGRQGASVDGKYKYSENFGGDYMLERV